MKNTFEWQGFTFHPVRRFTKKENRLGLRLPLHCDRSLACVFSKYDGGLWNYNEFYEAAGGHDKCLADIFHCDETGRDYIPGDNNLWEYNENEVA